MLNFRHEKPTDPDDPLADQNIKDRYYGINDPVADKLLKRASTMPRLDPPDDKTITTLYVGGLGDTITESDLRCVGAFACIFYALGTSHLQGRKSVFQVGKKPGFQFSLMGNLFVGKCRGVSACWRTNKQAHFKSFD